MDWDLIWWVWHVSWRRRWFSVFCCGLTLRTIITYQLLSNMKYALPWWPWFKTVTILPLPDQASFTQHLIELRQYMNSQRPLYRWCVSLCADYLPLLMTTILHRSSTTTDKRISRGSVYVVQAHADGSFKWTAVMSDNYVVPANCFVERGALP